MIPFTAIIPARFASTRLPRKPLLELAGKPMVVHVMERAYESGASRVIVATDHPDIMDAVCLAGGEACLTRDTHQSGTERLAEVIEYYQLPDDGIIVNIQGDEPLIPPEIIRQVATNLAEKEVNVATLTTPITDENDIVNPNIVKVVVDHANFALYFSRAAIPCDRAQCLTHSPFILANYHRHIGLYAYRTEFIRRYHQWQPTQLEKIELLEQLRILWYGEKIHVDRAITVPPAGVDTEDDFNRVCAVLSQQ